MPTSSAETRAPERVTLIPVTFLNGAWVWDEHARQPQPGIPYATAVEYVRADLASAENAGGEARCTCPERMDWDNDSSCEYPHDEFTPEPSGAGELRGAVQRFVDDFGRNGSKTGRADYGRWVPLDRFEELRALLHDPATGEP